LSTVTASAFALMFLLLCPAPSAGQSSVVPRSPSQIVPTDGPVGLDETLLWRVNELDGRAPRLVFGLADYTAYPVYYAILPVVWAPVALAGVDSDTAVQLTAGMIGSYALVKGLKHLVGRERPVAAHSWVKGRPQYPGGEHLDRYSMPSGHSAMAAAIAATLSLRYPQWEVVAPATLWALAVGGSRPWLGVHYPSDVVAGWALGVGAALIVHELRNNRDSESFGESPLFRFAIPLG
jgi:membrane-associated phospholipid phosphatase